MLDTTGPRTVTTAKDSRAGAGEAARLLDASTRGDAEAATTLLPLVYDELRRLARSRVARIGPNETLTPTELVHEAYVRIADGRLVSFEGRRHFFFVAARSMRDILVEKARQKECVKRGGHLVKVTFDGLELAVASPRTDLLDLDRAIEKLERESPERAQVVVLGYFAGLTQAEIGQVLGISRATVERRWSYARAWLRRELCTRRSAPA